MPRRKQSNPQPVKCEYDDGIVGADPDTLVLESNLLLGQDLGFEDTDFKIVGFDPDCASGDMGMAMYSMSEEEHGSYKQLSLGSDVEERPDTASENAFQPQLACRGCGGVLNHPDQPLCFQCSSLDLSGRGLQPTGSNGIGCRPIGKTSRGNGRHRAQRQNKPTKFSNTSSSSANADASADGDGHKVFSCQLCSFTSRYSNHLKRHMKTHNGEKPYKCPCCPYASAQLVNLQRHMRTHTGEKPYQCMQCPFACSSLGNLRRHQRMHAQERPHVCSQCSYRASSSLSLKRHMASHKSCQIQGQPTEEGVMSNLMLCFSGSDADLLHSYGSLEEDQPPPSLLDPESDQEDQVTPPLLLPCGLDQSPTSPANGHPASNPDPTKEPPESLVPPPTGDSPSSQGPERLYTCPSCPFSSCYPNHLVRHSKTHSGEKPHRCPHCPYASAHLDNLKRHLRVHTGEKPYACSGCDYACGNLANLRRHERIHSGAKPFQCPRCPYSCNQSMNLKRHMLRHSGHKPHQCPQCNYTTGHWDNYKRHQKKHSSGGGGDDDAEGHGEYQDWAQNQLPKEEQQD